MERSKTCNNVRVAGVTTLVAFVLSGCLHENNNVAKCGSNGTSIEVTRNPKEPDYKRPHDPIVIEPLFRDWASQHSTLFDDINVGIGEIVCYSNGKQVLTEQAAYISNTKLRAD